MPNPAEAKTNRLEAARVRMLDHLKETLTIEMIRRVQVQGFTPTDYQVNYAMAYVSARPLDSARDIAKAAGVADCLPGRWRKTAGYRAWITQVALMAVSCAVPLIWRVLGEQAAAGDKQAAKMILERFDLEWTARKAGLVPPPTGTPDEAGLKEERKRLLHSGSDSLAGVDGECGAGPVGKTGAQGEQPTPTGTGSDPEAEGGGGGGRPPIHPICDSSPKSASSIKDRPKEQ